MHVCICTVTHQHVLQAMFAPAEMVSRRMYNTHKRAFFMYYCIWVDIGHLWTPKHPLGQTVITGTLARAQLSLCPRLSYSMWLEKIFMEH